MVWPKRHTNSLHKPCIEKLQKKSGEVEGPGKKQAHKKKQMMKIMSSISSELERGSPHNIFQHNIKNSMYHVIRDHRRCSQDFCTYERTESAELPWPDDSTKEIQVCENKNFHLLAEHICLLRWPSSIIFLEHTPTHVSWFIVIEVPMGVINLMSVSSDRSLIFLLPIFLNLVWGNALEDVRLHYAPFYLYRQY